MNDILLVSCSEANTKRFKELLKKWNDVRIVTAKSAQQAKELLSDSNFDLILINSPLSDESGIDFALFAANETLAAICIAVENEAVEEAADKLCVNGVFVIEKPLKEQSFYQVIRLVEIVCKRVYGLQKKNIMLSGKIDEIKLINRAKCVLMESLNMTEQQSHRYIEKQAMDMRETRKRVAENILKTYQT